MVVPLMLKVNGTFSKLQFVVVDVNTFLKLSVTAQFGGGGNTFSPRH